MPQGQNLDGPAGKRNRWSWRADANSATGFADPAQVLHGAAVRSVEFVLVSVQKGLRNDLHPV